MKQRQNIEHIWLFLIFKKVELTNIETKTTTVFESIRKAAIELNTNHSTLRRCIINQKLFKDIYEIKAR